jgi:unsaturated chondroitin disaccharide hydrolase
MLHAQVSHAEAPGDALLRSAEASATLRVRGTETTIPAEGFTYYTRNNAWVVVGPDGWTSGYLPGELWQLYALTGTGWYRTRANARLWPLDRRDATSTASDIGMRYFYSCALDYNLTEDASSKAAAIQAANAMAMRFNSAVGAVKSREETGSFPVIIDELMNVQLLWWASDHGGSPALRAIAYRHTLTAARDFVRPDGSTYHLVSYDASTGAVLERETVQGYSNDSTWARGQAWAIHGFATGYRETHSPTMLSAARAVADRYLADVPSDMVPYWDFSAPDIPNAPRDSSAAAIAASGLIDLSLVDPNPANRSRYEAAARATLLSLSSAEYFSGGPNPAILLHGTMNYRTGTYDVGQSFGDYFYLEALQRLRRLTPARPPLRIVRAKASSGKPYSATDRSPSTVWKSKGKQWIDVDLGHRSTVSAVGVGVRWGASRSATLKVLVSYDRKHWRTVRIARSSGDWDGVETYSFAPCRARYVRLAVNGTSHNLTNGITTLRVY